MYDFEVVPQTETSKCYTLSWRICKQCSIGTLFRRPCAPDSSHIIKSPQAQRDQITVNRRILLEILDTDKRRLLQLIPLEKIAEILRAIRNHRKEVLLGLAKALAKVYQRKLTAVQTRLNGVEFVEPADQDGSEEQEQSGRAKWLQQSSPDGDARFVRDTATEEPEPRTLLPSHALPFYADLPAPVFRSLQWQPDQEIETSGYLNAFCCPPTAFCS
ncbi:hypothetical protein T02_14105 [Trichinella nativa]|uniref:Uncharacterized protein n=1 Tax=Trichinella nativa TaxID=6335 RepID=A0A0V1LLP8_9BILA|nr:hypothetical protein T02_14105 [Trichinella nativa]